MSFIFDQKVQRFIRRDPELLGGLSYPEERLLRAVAMLHCLFRRQVRAIHRTNTVNRLSQGILSDVAVNFPQHLRRNVTCDLEDDLFRLFFS